MRKMTFWFVLALFYCSSMLLAQYTREVVGDDIDPDEYHGVTVANGVVGDVSLAQPMKVQDVVLNGTYDYYQRGRVSNILKTFNYLNMNLVIDGYNVDVTTVSNYILSILYNRIGNIDKAAEVFAYRYKRNEVPPFGVISEAARGSNPYFATGAVGMLQAVLVGFGGLDFGPGGVYQRDTQIPDDWKELIMTGVGRYEKTFTAKSD